MTIYCSWLPATSDPADEHLVDCAMNANAAHVSFNMREFRAVQILGLDDLPPAELLTELARLWLTRFARSIHLNTLTLPLAQTLRGPPEMLAPSEGVTPDQSILYKLARQVSFAHTSGQARMQCNYALNLIRYSRRLVGHQMMASKQHWQNARSSNYHDLCPPKY